MSRNKTEVLNWLNSQVGLIVPDKSDARLNGQCVALPKGLMDFLGVPNPYAARGNAKDAGDTYLRQGIAREGAGWLTIIVNRDMGGGYGHIWIDLQNTANFEQNGAWALHTTKNTRPYTQGQQFINFDQWILPDNTNPPSGGNMNERGMSPAFIKRTYYMVNNQTPTQAEIDLHMAKSNPESFINGFGDTPLWKSVGEQRDNAIKERNNARTERDKADERIKQLEAELANGGGNEGEFVKVLTAGQDFYTKQ